MCIKSKQQGSFFSLLAILLLLYVLLSYILLVVTNNILSLQMENFNVEMIRSYVIYNLSRADDFISSDEPDTD